MDSKTLSSFKNDLINCFKNIVNEFPEVEVMLQREVKRLEMKYPALVQKLHVNEAKEESKLINIKEEMLRNKSNELFKDYTGIENTLKSDNPEECIESINTLQKANNNSQRKIL